MIFMWILLGGALAFAAYVRLAPSDIAAWHKAGRAEAPKDFSSGAVRAVRGGAEALERLDEIAKAEPRTKVLAGSVAEEMITYVTRSKLWGFPDYTTLWIEGENIYMLGRLRFGRSDLGVNRARLERWIAQF